MIFQLSSVVRDYVAEAAYELLKANVSLVCHPEETIGGCLGWYSSHDREMHVCMGGDDETWLGAFVHEFQHFRQDKSKARCWTLSADATWLGAGYAPYDCDTLFEAIFVAKSKKREIRWLDDAQRMEVARRVLEVERDCELRTLDEIYRYRLPINEDRFRQDAFRNVASYAVAYYVGEWRTLGRKNIHKLPTDLNVDFFAWASDKENNKLWTKDVAARKGRLQLPGNGHLG